MVVNKPEPIHLLVGGTPNAIILETKFLHIQKIHWLICMDFQVSIVQNRYGRFVLKNDRKIQNNPTKSKIFVGIAQQILQNPPFFVQNNMILP